MKTLLIIAATPFEVAPLEEFLATQATKITENHYQFHHLHIHLAITGIGLVATSYWLCKSLASLHPDYVIQLGIAGVYERSIALGEVVHITYDLIADLGALDINHQFLTLVQLGLSEPSAQLLSNSFDEKQIVGLQHLPKALGQSVHTITGDPAQNRIGRFPNLKVCCTTESMEGAAAHYLCLQEKLNFIQIRSISNYVEPRNKAHWNMPLALSNLNDFAIKLIKNIA